MQLCLDEFIDHGSFEKIYESIRKGVELEERNYEKLVAEGDNVLGDEEFKCGYKLTLFENYKPTISVDSFPELIEWIEESDVFDKIMRVVFYINPKDTPTPVHHDGESKNCRNQFLWIDFMNEKKLFIMDDDMNKRYISGKFNTFFGNKYHGCDPVEQDCFSIRVDGPFSDRFISIDEVKNFLDVYEKDKAVQ